MRKYPPENWQRLGQWIHDARTQAGMADINEWAAEVGRSTRILYGLERGEPVSAKTLEAVSEALGVARWYVFSVLTQGENTGLGRDDVRRLRQEYQRETGRAPDHPDDWQYTYLPDATDQQLLDELARRLRAQRQEAPHDRDTPTTTRAGESPAAGVQVHPDPRERPRASGAGEGPQDRSGPADDLGQERDAVADAQARAIDESTSARRPRSEVSERRDTAARP